jgi:hypothetical protein
MDRKDFTYEANANGYMLFYKGKPIGGAGVKLPRENPLHWKHARRNVQEFTGNAGSEIELILEGRGQKRFIDAIERSAV